MLDVWSERDCKIGRWECWSAAPFGRLFGFPSRAEHAPLCFLPARPPAPKYGPTPTASCPPTSVLHQDPYQSLACRPTKWSCTTRSDAGDGDAQNSCKITVLAFQTFRQNILSLICMYIYVVCLSDSQLTQCRNFGLHGLPKKFTHVHQFSCIHVWVWHSTHKCSPFQK